MPILFNQSSHTAPWPPKDSPFSAEARVPTFQTIGLFLAAASLVVACLQFMQHRGGKKEDVQQGYVRTGADSGREDIDALSIHAVRRGSVNGRIELEEAEEMPQ